MKKLEILKLIEANLRVDKTYKFLPYHKRQLPNWWFHELTDASIVPKIEGLTTELNQLREATKKIARETKEAKDLIKSTDCKHEIRLSKYHHFGVTHECILCGKRIDNNPHDYWDPAELHSTYCINYKHKYQDEYDDTYIIKDGHTKEKLYSKIVTILKDKTDDEEIDLVKELKKLNLKHAEYIDIEIKPETFIMIIGGTNKQFVENGAYITIPKLDVVKDIYSYFAGQEDTKLLVIDNEDVINSIDHFRNMKKASYSSIGELENILKEHKHDYKLIIDMADLYDYKVSGNEIIQEEHELRLQEMYPNSKVIKINNSTKDKIKNKEYMLKLVNKQEKED